MHKLAVTRPPQKIQWSKVWTQESRKQQQQSLSPKFLELAIDPQQTIQGQQQTRESKLINIILVGIILIELIPQTWLSSERSNKYCYRIIIFNSDTYAWLYTINKSDTPDTKFTH